MKKKFILQKNSIALCAHIMLLTACGGGSDSSTEPMATLSGFVGIGAAIKGATVTADCLSTDKTLTTRSFTAQTDAQGRYTISLSNATVPCLLKATGGTAENTSVTDKFYSYANAAGTANITPLTSLVVTNALKADPSAASSAFNSTVANTINNNLANAKNYVNQQLDSITIGRPTGDILTSSMAVGDANDQKLDAYYAVLENNGKTHQDAVTMATTSTNFSTQLASERLITLKFSGMAGNEPVQCGTVIKGLGGTQVDAKLKDFRFYLSNIALITTNDEVVPLRITPNDWTLVKDSDTVTLIDLEDGSGACVGGTTATNDFVQGKVPATKRYSGVQMSMGVPFALNHTDYSASSRPLDVQAMAWSWQSGRKFAKIEVTDPSGSTWPAKTFNVHLGSTGCTGNPASGEIVNCKAPNRMNFHFHSFDDRTQSIGVDIKSLLSGVADITRNTDKTAAGCMSGGTDPECLGVFNALKIDWKADGTGSGLPIDEGHGQTLFKVITR